MTTNTLNIEKMAASPKGPFTVNEKDDRFFYEPMISGHPDGVDEPMSFLGRTMNIPMWLTAVPGDLPKASIINQRLARVCGEFGLGLGLGSCRPLLENPDAPEAYMLRQLIGEDHPFFANLGIAQIEHMLARGEERRAEDMVHSLDADGLIIHVNPLQAWLSASGERIQRPPIDTVADFLDRVSVPVVVKEVGHGMGPVSLRALFQLKIAAVEFAAYDRKGWQDHMELDTYGNITRVGHHAEEMVLMTNRILDELGGTVNCGQVIISGGIPSFLDGYHLVHKLKCRGVYGQGASLLPYAERSYTDLREYIGKQIRGWQLANAFLDIR